MYLGRGPFLFQRSLDLESEPAGSLNVGGSNSPRLVLRRLKADRATSDRRVEIPVAVVALETDGRQAIGLGRIENESEIVEHQRGHGFVLEFGFHFPNPLEPREGSAEVAHRDVNVVEA